MTLITKKRVIKLIIGILVLACAAPFFLKDRQGRPLITLDRIVLPRFTLPDIDLSFLKRKAPAPETEILAEGSIVPVDGQKVVKMYTFKDDKGVVHFTDRKPIGDGVKVLYLPAGESSGSSLNEVKEKIGDLARKGKAVLDAGNPEKPSASPALSLLPAPYSEAGKTLEDARDLKEQVEDIYSKREAMMKE
jgi:hypothetical protein